MSQNLARITHQADQLYALRASLANVRASIEVLHTAAQPFDPAVTWRLARAYFFLGQEALDKGEALAWHKRGATVCRRAVRDKQRASVENHFWYGVNLALQANLESPPLIALHHALQAKRALQQAVNLDASYHAAGPLRVLARLQHKLPPIFGGGKERARDNFERAIQIDPTNTVTRLYFAEMLLDVGDTPHAITQLETLLTLPDDPTWKFEIERDRCKAIEMLEEFIH